MKDDVFEKMNSWGKSGEAFFFLFDFEMENPIAEKLSEMKHSDISFSLSGGDLKTPPEGFFEKKPFDFDRYKKAFACVQRELKKGNSYLLNLTFPVEIDFSYTLNEIYRFARAPYKLLWKDRFVCFSPESFVSIKNGMIRTFPMKGTMSASVPNAEELLLSDEKEQAEHITVTDLLRNDLGQFCRSVEVPRYRYLSRVPTSGEEIFQTSSEICGTLPADWKSRLGDYFSLLLPAGSVSGAPKKKTLEIIRRAEGQKRGYYCGVFGIFDGESVDSAVIIRFIEKKGNEYFYRAGGGITVYSDLRREYEEMMEKVYLPF